MKAIFSWVAFFVAKIQKLEIHFFPLENLPNFAPKN